MTPSSRLVSIRTFVSSPDGACVAFPFEPGQNRYGTLHGGCIATAVDVVSTAALVTVSPDPGVSADLSVRYLSRADPVSRTWRLTPEF